MQLNTLRDSARGRRNESMMFRRVYCQRVWHTQSTTVVVNQPMAAERPGPVRLLSSSEPTDTVCFNCGQVVVTYLYHESGSCTYVSCIFLAVIG
ncbi:hypothetical protein LSAT2_002103 [Lamellibrachia satsuma]|nr:hypothetical protein LSAT2_002103 [Lamellibrachia satsuma]